MLIPKNLYAQVTYYMKCKKFLNLKNPQTFDERIWWLKFHYFNPLMTQCSDKIAVREYVKKCGLEEILNDCYGHYESVDEIDVDKIPSEEFFLKVNNTSGGNLYCKKDTFDKEKIRPEFSALLKDNFYWHGREYNYKYIKPCIIAEKVLKADDDIGLIDYKFLCFEGEPRLLFMDIGVANADGTHAEEYYRNIYDMDFNLVSDMKETRDTYRVEDIKKPEKWDCMLECCRRLAKPFPHCRVDLYYVGGQVYFGEITFFHGSGYNEFEPREKDLMVGSWIPMDRSFPSRYPKSATYKL
jgi:hypothetical protein